MLVVDDYSILKIPCLALIKAERNEVNFAHMNEILKESRGDFTLIEG